MSRRRAPGALVAAAVLTAALAAAPAVGVALLDRTFRISAAVNNLDANGASTRPQVSPNGADVVFDSTATNLDADLNGAVRDVFRRETFASRTTLVSEAIDGDGANGPSSHASIAGDVVAWQSTASNLVAGDTNGHRDVFVRALPGAVRRISVAPGGAQANGPSGEADVSANQRFVAFTSAATNLAPRDGNGGEDVFVHDRSTGALERVSEVAGRAANGRSRQPAISADGRYVSFASTADDLVPDDTNGVMDVFVVDRVEDTIERVSVSTGEREQDAAVAEPFSQVSDVSRNGRYVVFDSDAANLVEGDTNQDTDVFVRDRRRGTTQRASLDSLDRQGDNDSFYPSLSNDGRFVVFNSFAENLAPGDHASEDVFMRDLRARTTALVNVGSRGQQRGTELVPQLLQRPSVNSTGDVVAFTSTAGNLVQGDGNGAEDVFARFMTPPAARITRGPRGVVRTARPRLRVSVDDRLARRLLCTLDGIRFPCARKGRLPRMGNGKHVLRVRAGGAGMRFERRGEVRRFRVRGVKGRGGPRIRPRVRITAPSTRRFRGRVRGTARGGAGVVRVEVLILSSHKGRCSYFGGVEWERRPCRNALVVIADGTDDWEVELPESTPRGRISVRARAIDRRGARSDYAFRFAIQR